MKLGDVVAFRDPGAFNGEPQLAFVARIWGPDCLNLHVVDPNGATRGRGGETSVMHKRVASEGCSHWLTLDELEAERLAVAEASLSSEERG